MIDLKLPVCLLGQCHAIFAKIQRLNATGCVSAEGCFFGGRAEESGLSMLFLNTNVQAFNYQGSPSFLAEVQYFWRPQAPKSRLLGSSTDSSAVCVFWDLRLSLVFS